MKAKWILKCLVVLVTAGAAVAACSGGSPVPADTPSTSAGDPVNTATQDDAPEPPAPETTGDVEPTPKGPPKPWKEMTADDRKGYMTDPVMPRMKTEFGNFDADKYGNMTCKTCHGAGAAKGFTMPNPQIAKLPGGGNLQSVLKDHPAIAKFMMRNVVPNIVELLGVDTYDPDSKTGFGCYNCHATK